MSAGKHERGCLTGDGCKCAFGEQLARAERDGAESADCDNCASLRTRLAEEQAARERLREAAVAWKAWKTHSMGCRDCDVDHSVSANNEDTAEFSPCVTWYDLEERYETLMEAALSSSPSEALAEERAQVWEEAADMITGDAMSKHMRDRASDLRARAASLRVIIP